MFGVRAVSRGGGYAKYMTQEAEVGEWVGEGARELGLTGVVEEHEFDELRRGWDPKQDRVLRLNQVDRVYQKPWGEMEYKAREFYEITISAPKSVSIQAIVDPRVVEAHRKAVQRVLQDLEYVSQGKLVMAAWEHRMSRAGDPQLHTHVAVMNVMQDERNWHALRAKVLFENQRPFTAEYRASLLGEIEQRGYQIAYPEIAGIPEAMRDKYSQRSEQIAVRIEEYQEAHGVAPKPHVVQALVLNSRPEKDPRTALEIMQEQFARLAPEERVTLETLATEANHRMKPYMAPQLQPVEAPAERPEVEGPKPGLRQDVNFDPALPKYRWEYGEERKQRGPRIGF